jgi:hypothetical protein
VMGVKSLPCLCFIWPKNTISLLISLKHTMGIQSKVKSTTHVYMCNYS